MHLLLVWCMSSSLKLKIKGRLTSTFLFQVVFKTYDYLSVSLFCIGDNKYILCKYKVSKVNSKSQFYK